MELSKAKNMSDMVSVVKLTSLLFCGIAVWQHVLNWNEIVYENNNVFYTQVVLSAVLLLALTYFTWAFFAINKFKGKTIYYAQIGENLILVLIFFFVIIMSGASKSEYKLMFLFIIITTTIQSGMKQGLIWGGISSVCVLTMDLFYESNSGVNEYFQNDIILTGVFMLSAWTLGFYVKIANEHIEDLTDLANIDGLTSVYNHRYFQDALKEKIKLCNKKKQPVSLVFIDIDHFKDYNDLYGHQKGDYVLKVIGQLLKEAVRQDDIVARYGGEEFVIVLPNASEKSAIEIAERIRKNIEDTYFEGEENQPDGKLTVSMGISVYPEKAKNDVELIKSADDALYRAKFFNKNRVETYSSILDELKKDIDEEHTDLITSIKTLISVINAKDRYTYGHVERVVYYAKLLADKLEMSEEEKQNFIYGAYMHDIGKINISQDVLLKKMPLTNEEWKLLQEHPYNGVEIIKPVKTLNKIIPIILFHHEKYDGSGYPHKLAGEDIPYHARALSVVDSFDAMTSDRPYNKRKTYLEGIDELRRCKGSHFDPEIVDAFVEVLTENIFQFNF